MDMTSEHDALTTVTSSPPPPAQVLLDLLGRLTGNPPPTDEETDKAMSEFVGHLAALDRQHNRKDRSERYLVETVFGRARLFKNDVERVQYCRCHLHVSVAELSKLSARLKNSPSGGVTAASLAIWADTIRDYIFDLQDVVPFLQRNQPDYVYLIGFKNPTVHSWEVFRLARSLAYHSAFFRQNGFALDHKAAQIAAIAVLRQALELRFERLVSVYPTDKKGKPPRLWHGFHQDFIVANPRFFQAQGFSIQDLKPVYDWCSEIVHQAYQPYAWQIAWALELSGRLLGARDAPPTEPWSIANGVEVVDVQEMQNAFEVHFLETYEHGEWKMTRRRPEALVRHWTSAMAVHGEAFRPVRRRPSLLRRIAKRISRLWTGKR
ncbi:hypothetical protein [Bradyrhizobium guangzhouense]|uniref:hypothetical protein n=1 Tax=Bradyrhizobium guangzhouense TaxID=1325095 RepID=UPI00100909A1|nr:hypothetical protein [Bradyrhizobium guangzhouense]